MSRKYFFRSGYELSELKQRISIKDIRNTDLPVVENLIKDTNITHSDLNGSKQEIYNALSRNLADVQRYNFYKEILEQCGDKGDIFNLQLLFGDPVDQEVLIDKLSNKKRDVGPSELISSKISNSIIDYVVRNEEVVDIKFVVPNEPERYDLDDVDDPESIIDDFYAEARVYCDKGIIAHSRRSISDDEKEKLRKVLNTLCQNSLSRYPSISPNEMLAVQNAMDGENEGINYGDFEGGKSINSARYRGAKNLKPTNSTIVKPAAESGKITGLLFYYNYKSGKASRDILIRMHDDARLTCSNIYTEPDLIDDLVDELSRIQMYSEFFKTSNEIVEKYKYNVMNSKLVVSMKSYHKQLNMDLRVVADEYVNKEDIKPVEMQMFLDLIFNLCINLVCEDLTEYDEPNDIKESVEKEDDLQQKLEDYRNYETNCSMPNYDLFWEHLYDIISIDFSRPVDIIEYAKDSYDI